MKTKLNRETAVALWDTISKDSDNYDDYIRHTLSDTSTIYPYHAELLVVNGKRIFVIYDNRNEHMYSRVF